MNEFGVADDPWVEISDWVGQTFLSARNPRVPGIPARSGRFRRRGFTFTEVLFAVMILGIGFIMVAAMFPVAIRQTQDTVEEATAGSTARNAALLLERIATNANFPQTVNGQVVQYNGNAAAAGPSFWQAVGGELISSTDRRFAWIPFYCRAANSPNAQIVIIAVTARPPAASFVIGDTLPASNGYTNLQGRSAVATFTHNAGAIPDTIMFPNSPTDGSMYATEGTYVIVADDSMRTSLHTSPPTGVTCNGFVYRLGNLESSDASGKTWDLMPGSDMKTPSSTTPLRQPTDAASIPVFLVGAGVNSAANGAAAGPAINIAAYTTFIPIHN